MMDIDKLREMAEKRKEADQESLRELCDHLENDPTDVGDIFHQEAKTAVALFVLRTLDREDGSVELLEDLLIKDLLIGCAEIPTAKSPVEAVRTNALMFETAHYLHALRESR